MPKIPRPRPSHLPEAPLPPDLTEPEDANGSLSRDPSDPPGNRGQRLPEINEPDQEEVVEETVLRGVEKAQEDQMRASGQIEPRRRRTRAGR